jgi:hypothetical protein
VTHGPASIPKFLYCLRAKKKATRTGCGEGGSEPDAVLTDAVVSACDEDADTMQAKTSKQVAHVPYLISRMEHFTVAFRDEDRLWDGQLFNDVFKPGEVQVIRARRPAAGAVEDVRGRERYALSVLHFHALQGSEVGTVDLPAIDRYYGEGQARRDGAMPVQEPD